MLAATFTAESRPADAVDVCERPRAAAFAVFPPAAPVADHAPVELALEQAQVDVEVEPRHAPRRYAHGELLLAAFIGARRPLTFEDLAGVLVGTGARVSELVGWMASSQANGLIVSQGFALDPVGMPTGPRLFALSDEARAELRARRSRRRTRVAA